MSDHIDSDDLGTGMLSKAAKALQERKKRQEEMNKRFGIKTEKKEKITNHNR